jgi:hypothetical protein
MPKIQVSANSSLCGPFPQAPLPASELCPGLSAVLCTCLPLSTKSLRSLLYIVL